MGTYERTPMVYPTSMDRVVPPCVSVTDHEVKRDLLAECGGARSGSTGRVNDDRPDAVASRRGDRYVWARLTHPDGELELTVWCDGRWTLERKLKHTGAVYELAAGTLEVMLPR